MSPRKQSWRAYQFADEPESALTITLSGSRGDSSANRRIGLIGSASSNACMCMVSHHRATSSSRLSRHFRSVLRERCGISARSVVAASPIRLTWYGYRIPIIVGSMSICTAFAWSNAGMNWVYGKLDPTVSSVSQLIIIS